MRRVVLFVLATLISACAVTDNVARDRAKSVVNSVVDKRFPGVNAAPVTDCIIDAASGGEIINIASASVTGVTQSTVEDVLEISQRPDSLKCIARNGLSLFGA